MLRIRPQQLAALSAIRRERFARELAEYLCGRFPSVVAGLTEEELLRRVQIAMERAERHGLGRRVDVRGFVTFTFALGLAFDRHPAVQSVLCDTRIPAEEKIDYLVGRVTPAEWAEARALGGEELWEKSSDPDV